MYALTTAFPLSLQRSFVCRENASSRRTLKWPRERWKASVVNTECTLHQISPYIGKIKSSIAAAILEQFTSPGECVYDPFSGSGTVALEAWIRGRSVVSNDLNRYAAVLTRAKLHPPPNKDSALSELLDVAQKVALQRDRGDSRSAPDWVRDFYHPKTLRQILAWVTCLRRERRYFLLACLLGILHHQRPGFLSFPSSHTVPYLRTKKFPRSRFAELYKPREILPRLERKILRCFRRVPVLDTSLSRAVYQRRAETFLPNGKIDAIITSPPYMRQLDYGRDNRLRLWFLGKHDCLAVDRAVTPGEPLFFRLMHDSLVLWKRLLAPGAHCVLVLGDSHSSLYRKALPEAVADLATKDLGGYSFVGFQKDPIPAIRRVRRLCRGNSYETILVLRRNVGV